MSVSTEVSRSTYVGNGVTTDFATGFRFLANSEVVVKTVTSPSTTQVTLVEGVNYTLTGATLDAGGTVAMFASYPASVTIIIERTVPFEQNTSFRDQGQFNPAVHEDAMDEIVFQTQQLARRVADIENGSLTGDFTAGSGLSMAATTLNVGAGAGLQANADDIEVIFGPATTVVYAGGSYNGLENKAARSDHGHDVAVGPPVDLVAGGALSGGSGAYLALANHVHGVPTDVPVDVTKAAAAEGAADTFARSDHKHDISTAAATTLTDASNAEGTATSLARSDHTHSHGARGGGTLHAVAVSGGAAGFMSGTDKASLDALALSRSHVHAGTSAGQSINNNVATRIVFGTELFDTLNEFNAATGVFTATRAGYYHVSCGIGINSAAASAEFLSVTIYAGGVPILAPYQNSTAGAGQFTGASATFHLGIGDTIEVYVLQTCAGLGARTLTSGASQNYVTIDRID